MVKPVKFGRVLDHHIFPDFRLVIILKPDSGQTGLMGPEKVACFQFYIRGADGLAPALNHGIAPDTDHDVIDHPVGLGEHHGGARGAEDDVLFEQSAGLLAVKTHRARGM